ncbi:Nif3-like dinuclear metal center hexameric protein [Salimicrobium halophilum]|uniref:GTP cyclohydrolase 1 type 2 homolog n=1 Tax=Salimicrobium halophilum TaxID=86666 RepID=A0A1G8PRW1_9BACI|nr:Nif3-like dinuclear metal center hexameric protein [Salimicrobium halophilum]SDI94945.1 dinuclear metal center protein, YbgI/SA1388 family [Salimicrobium halophilum]
MNTVKANDVIKVMEEWAPESWSFDWDNVGLQVGSKNKQVSKVMVTLDVLENVVDEAIQKDIDLIVAHHPLLFVKPSAINTDQPKGRILQKLLSHDITVYASHTNLDIAEGGVNDVLSEAIGVTKTRPFVSNFQENVYKVAVHIPVEHAERLRSAISDAGAGHLGDYSHCTFQIAGEGTFKPLDGADPYIGNTGELEKVKELKVETIVKEKELSAVIDAIHSSHPYEEPAYDVYRIEINGEDRGLGRIGELAEKVTLDELVEEVKRAYDVPAVRVTGARDKKVKTVAVVGGSGEDFFKAAKAKGADVLITGDVTFHKAQDALEMGLAIIDPGHHVEKLICSTMKEKIEEEHDIEVLLSESDTEPFRFQ